MLAKAMYGDPLGQDICLTCDTFIKVQKWKKDDQKISGEMLMPAGTHFTYGKNLVLAFNDVKPWTFFTMPPLIGIDITEHGPHETENTFRWYWTIETHMVYPYGLSFLIAHTSLDILWSFVPPVHHQYYKHAMLAIVIY